MKVNNKGKTDGIRFMPAVRFLIRALDSAVDFTALILFMLLLFFGVYSVWDTNQVQTAASNTSYQIYKPTVTDTRTFDDFKALNSDVFGWLNIYGTNIDYPLLQSDDNEKYLNTSADGKYSLSGSIFLDYRNKNDMTDFNNIIHGHHMEGDVMFGEIGYFKEKSYFEQHKYGEIFYDGKYHGLEFFAFLEVDAYDSDVFRAPIYDDSGKTEYLSLIQEKAINYRDIGVTSEDRIVLLATCTSAITNGRHILVGVISDDIQQNSFALQENTEMKAEQNFSVKAASWQFILLAIIIVLILLLILIIVILYLKRKKQGGNKNK